MTYREFVLSRMNPAVPPSEYLLNAAMGLSGEAGEVLEHLKKARFHGRELNATAVIKELGDVRFYLELAAHALGVEMGDIEARNIDKLMTRFPDGFVSQPQYEG